MDENNLEQVIVRFDFLSPIDIYDKVDSEIIKEISRYFKKANPKTQISNLLFVSTLPSEESKQLAQPLNEKAEVQWTFSSNEGDKFTISSKSLFLVCKKYTKYDRNIIDRLYKPLELVFDTYQVQIRRIGLRYINKIPISKESILDERILSYKGLFDGYNIAKFLNNTELSVNTEEQDISVRIKYGLSENETIGDINTYTLDIDGYSLDTLYDYRETIRVLELIHDEIKKIYHNIVK